MTNILNDYSKVKAKPEKKVLLNVKLRNCSIHFSKSLRRNFGGDVYNLGTKLIKPYTV